MIRGTTANFKFNLPYTKKELAWATIKFWQPSNPSASLPIIKTLDNCGEPDQTPGLCVSLSPTETALFSDKYKAKVQLRAEHNGVVVGTRDILLTVYPMPDDIIENDQILPTDNVWIVLDGRTIG